MEDQSMGSSQPMPEPIKSNVIWYGCTDLNASQAQRDYMRAHPPVADTEGK
jgi:hypothetical protein